MLEFAKNNIVLQISKNNIAPSISLFMLEIYVINLAIFIDFQFQVSNLAVLFI